MLAHKMIEAVCYTFTCLDCTDELLCFMRVFSMCLFGNKALETKHWKQSNGNKALETKQRK